MLKSVYRVWDFWIYRQFRKSVKRISKDLISFPYFVQLEMDELNRELKITDSLKESTKCFYDSLISCEGNSQDSCDEEMKTFSEWLLEENQFRDNKMDRDFNASLNLKQIYTASSVGIEACGDGSSEKAISLSPSAKQEFNKKSRVYILKV